MKEYTDKELQIIIENCKDYIEDAQNKIRQYKSWGLSWANSSFSYDAQASLQRWIKNKNKAQDEINMRKNKIQ